MDSRPKPLGLQMVKIRRMITPLFSRLVLIPAPRDPRPSVVVRRFRLARLDLSGRAPANGDRFGHLKRVYD